ncbi:hypothetical protein VOLCADRAFT_97868 [Volvox carteri f. nagariensis]|uniref:Uncharacterized protein n=1 Tax=Volvox carteri f. nagariensis TaxID=3068 RepID=D8UDV2_VOLCA|nr:uncharacterized protein VOLCADRAFT_97868 [Volvox carteri f. nagariensis]EFJ42110.1 hypothetical protein VOLCADRAFT_97868 [Volvox carteri f. nagariensis]|eukprot:XP_002956807.1 hypothetical protein VOLCADRAFT_97868 [Volvox carteri f. nagariensis]
MFSLPLFLCLVALIAFVHCFALTRAQPAECLAPQRRLIEEYKAFHNANKFSPDAQYLVHACWGGSCSGTGDRIRGALWLLRVAIAHKKILLVDWTKPAPLTDFLVPNEIDWSFSGLDPALFRIANTLDMDDFNDAVYRQVPAALERFRATKVYATSSNEQFEVNGMVGITPVLEFFADGACYFNFLFKPHPAIVARGDAHLQQLYGSASVDYVAWHWRHFDADERSESPVMVSELTRVLNAAARLGSDLGLDLDQRPVLLITDFNIAQGSAIWPFGWAGPDY